MNGPPSSAFVAAFAAFEVDEPVRCRLARFAELLLARNVHLNLTAARDPAAVAEHVADALAVAPYVRSPLVDVGSGGGFPAIPLAIVTGCEVTLVEATLKKARFLEELVSELTLRGRVVPRRAEEAAREPTLRDAFASATARAVANLATTLELTVPFLAVGGVAVLQRGRLDEAERRAAHDAALVLGATVEAEVAGEALGGRSSPAGARRLVLVIKRAPSPPRFPRRAGVPSRRPLCWEGRGSVTTADA